MKTLTLLTASLLALTLAAGCATDVEPTNSTEQSRHAITLDAPASLAEADRTYFVDDVMLTDTQVEYEVTTPAGLTRFVQFDADGLRAVIDAEGTLIQTRNMTPASPQDALIAVLDLPADPVVGYHAIEAPFAVPAFNDDAAPPAGIEAAYCERTISETTVDGCTQGTMVDDCGDTVYVMSYQKESGCNWFGFNCECEGSYSSIAYE